ncbi:AraC family transcriptional regulator [Paenibacillus ehimensis]|uniref:AraC family transcriptional regulator n=2 Tax=Paenibacillus ehimensis TaxID=79264 RepID=UPI002DB9D2F0|nr:AraC family transcriptional regulator [Paenibacillus ehimensis]MEC0208322.1 AraC family transcriptional regulator [Paenibacillus ehimensis]
MKQKPQDFGAIGAAPVLSSDKLERAGLRFSQWERLSPRQAYDGSTDARHVVAIHGSPGPVELSEYEPGGMNNGIARPGDIQIIPSGERAHCEWRQSLSFMKLEILPSKLEEVAAASGFGRSANLRLERRFLVQDPKLLQLSRWMLEELRSGGASGRLYWDSLSNLAAVHLLQHYTTSSQACLKPKPLTSAQVSRAIEFMHEHLEQDMTLEQLASAANVSLSHLVRKADGLTSLGPSRKRTVTAYKKPRRSAFVRLLLFMTGPGQRGCVFSPKSNVLCSSLFGAAGLYCG